MDTLSWMGVIGADLAVASSAWFAYAERRHNLIALLKIKLAGSLPQDRPLTRHPRWVSSQPAPHPHRLPTFVAQRVGPYPQSPAGVDWNYFTYVYVRPGAPVFLRGTVSPARIFSFTFYAKRHVDRADTASKPHVIESTALVRDGDQFEVCIGPRREAPNWLDNEGERHGVLVVRNYVFRGDTAIPYPAVYWGDELKQAACRVQVHSKLEARP